MQSEIFQKAEKTIRPELKNFVIKNLDLIVQINQILNAKNWQYQDLATKLNISEEKLNSWLSGTHKFTKTQIKKIEAVLEIRGEKLKYY